MNALSRIVMDLDSMGARGPKRFFLISAACEADRVSENGIFIYVLLQRSSKNGLTALLSKYPFERKPED